MYIGTKVKQLRKSKNMTLVELSGKSSVQIATLSRIENDKMIGTLESHMNIAKALDVNITDLYADIGQDNSKPDMVKPAAHAEMFIQNDKSSYEILSKGVLSRKMMPILLKLAPGTKTNIEEYKNPSPPLFFFFLSTGTWIFP